MSASLIKVVAIISMALDHVYVFLFPQLTVFHLIGRIAFPLFAWLIANGARYTSDMRYYLLRLLIFGLLSQIPYTLAYRLNDPSFWRLNVIITLFYGLLAIYILQAKTSAVLKAAGIFGILFISEFFRTEYGYLGVLLVFFSYVFYRYVPLIGLAQIIFVLIPLIYPLQFLYTHGQLSAQSLQQFPQLWAPLAIVFIALYNHREGFKTQYLFYSFYPLQYVFFYLARISFFR